MNEKQSTIKKPISIEGVGMLAVKAVLFGVSLMHLMQDNIVLFLLQHQPTKKKHIIIYGVFGDMSQKQDISRYMTVAGMAVF